MVRRRFPAHAVDLLDDAHDFLALQCPETDVFSFILDDLEEGGDGWRGVGDEVGYAVGLGVAMKVCACVAM
jgi:hypothetical protein